jgi:hypothetical protein
VRGYRAAGGDAGDDRLLSFLCAVRALVRAKVDLLRAGQLFGAAGDEHFARGYELLTLAERFAWRALLQRVARVGGRRRAGRLSRPRRGRRHRARFGHLGARPRGRAARPRRAFARVSRLVLAAPGFGCSSATSGPPHAAHPSGSSSCVRSAGTNHFVRQRLQMKRRSGMDRVWRHRCARHP